MDFTIALHQGASGAPARDLARHLLERHDQAFEPIATLCHGPRVPIAAGCAEGRRRASAPGVRDEVVDAGGIWPEDPS